ncbi:DUF3570 domain-containing protein [Pendulispora albinea]|uniref:DUF3570 domain-containing protein n=1 Tax=Pendulispora albinea TaxID=2741071 RepID=A0ABZ2LQT0_9BACT
MLQRRTDGVMAVLLAVTLHLLFLLAAPRIAHAALPDDAAAEEHVRGVLTEEYAKAQYSEAKRKLVSELERCRRPGRCSPSVKAQIYIALGMVASQLGVASEAKNHFSNAFSEDPSAKLPERATPTMRTQFMESRVKGVVIPPPPMPAPTETTAAQLEDTSAPSPGAAPMPAAPTGKIPGWENNQAFQYASAGMNADLAGNLEGCIENDKKSLELEEKARTRLHLASCENRAGKLIDALKNTQKALKMGIDQKDAGVMRAARQRVQDIVPRVPHVTFDPPNGVTNLAVKFDEREVKGDLRKKFSVDPGKHQVHAEGTGNGNALSYDEEIEVKEGETYTVKITMKSRAPEFLTQGQLACMTAAKNQEDVLKCLPSNAKNLVVKLGLDMSGYTDNTHVHVASPAINAQVISPTAGWNVGGSFLADFVTAASPDIVSTASRAFVERRYAGTLGGGYKVGIFGLQANGSFSSEPDYLNLNGGGSITADLNDKLITPRLAFSHSDGTIGRNDTPFSNVPLYHLGDKRKLYTNSFELGVTFVMSPTSVLVVGGTMDTERGDQSKIYRYVPMFSPNVAGKIQAGVPADVVNANRLPYRPQEQLPNERDRFAFALRFLHRFSSATLRLDQRLYYDTWQTKATTTDLRYVQDIGRHLRLWPHLRFHAQTGVNFYRLAYAALTRDDGTVVLPTYRTGDRELSPMIGATLGAGARIALGSPEATTQYAITVQGDYMYSYYFNSLYIVQRQALYGSFGFEVEFQ